MEGPESAAKGAQLGEGLTPRWSEKETHEKIDGKRISLNLEEIPGKLRVLARSTGFFAAEGGGSR